MTGNWSTFAVLVFMFLCVMGIASSHLSTRVKQLICVGLVLRVIGAEARLWTLIEFYDGSGDAMGYYRQGLVYAEALRSFDFTLFLDSTGWQAGRWWGTQFVRFSSGAVLTVIGPSLRSEFWIFSLLAFIGLSAFGAAFKRAYPNTSYFPYLRWIFLFPSLWFWPASVGKEAILMLGLGVAVLGFIGSKERPNWLLLATGAFLILAVRPQVAGVLLTCMMLAQLLSFGQWNPRRIIQGILLLVISLAGLRYSMTSVGIEEVGIEGIETYLETGKSRETTGRTSVAPVGVSITGVPYAMSNVLFRPLPWESSSILVLLASMEIIALWGIIILRRKNLAHSIRRWRVDRYVRLSLIFVVIYSVALGMTIVNLGIIARQRVFLFPFIFLLLSPQIPELYRTETGTADHARKSRLRRIRN